MLKEVYIGLSFEQGHYVSQSIWYSLNSVLNESFPKEVLCLCVVNGNFIKSTL